MAPAKRIREGTLVVDRYNVSGLNFPRTCSNDDCNRSGRYRMLILGWPAGDYCEKCMKGMTAAWDGAVSSPGVSTPTQPVAPGAEMARAA